MDEEGLGTGSGAMDRSATGNGFSERQDRAGVLRGGSRSRANSRHGFYSILLLPRTTCLRQHAGRNWPGPTRKQEGLTSMYHHQEFECRSNTHLYDSILETTVSCSLASLFRFSCGTCSRRVCVCAKLQNPA